MGKLSHWWESAQRFLPESAFASVSPYCILYMPSICGVAEDLHVFKFIGHRCYKSQDDCACLVMRCDAEISSVIRSNKFQAFRY